jgi:hypothetical protein
MLLTPLWVRRHEELILGLLFVPDANSQKQMPMYPFKIKAQVGLFSVQGTVRSEAKTWLRGRMMGSEHCHDG